MLRNGLYKIVRTNIKHFFLQHLLLAIGLIFATCLIFETNNLDQYKVAMPLELFVSLIGIVILTPIFAPEENRDIGDIMMTKSFSYFAIISIRLIYSCLTIVALIGGYIIFLSFQDSDVTMMHFLGTLASTILLGGIGIFLASMFNHVIVGYMGAMLFYMMNFFLGDQLEVMYLFGMAQGSSVEKYWHAVIGIVLIVIAFILRGFSKSRLR